MCSELKVRCLYSDLKKKKKKAFLWAQVTGKSTGETGSYLPGCPFGDSEAGGRDGTQSEDHGTDSSWEPYGTLLISPLH